MKEGIEMKKAFYFILMLTPLAITLCALPFLPDQIPAHYDIANQVDRWGSKYETLILPCITIVFGFIMLLAGKISDKMDEENKNEQIIHMTGMICMGLFTVMTIYFLFLGYISTENLNELPLSLTDITIAALGFVFILLGKIMPKTKMNSLIGLRTSGSMRNKQIWEKCQKFGGLTMMVTGIIWIINIFLFDGIMTLIISIVVLLLMTILDIIYSYKVS